MTDLRAGAQQALDALENAVRYHGIMLMSDPPQDAWKYHRVEGNAKQAITALREALAQPEQEQKYEKRIAPYSTTLSMLLNTTPPATKPEQEPSQWRDIVVVALVREGVNKHKARELADHFAAQRPWQGLTDEEIWSAVSRIGTSDSNVNPLTVLSDARAIEQRLKERNT